MMHETGLRILVRKVQLIGAQYDKALTPIFSHSTRHYMRIYFRCHKSKTLVDKIINNHKYLLFCNKCLEIKVHPQNKTICCKKNMAWAGPLWIGQLWDRGLIVSMLNKLDKDNPELIKFISIINAESKINTPYFFSTPLICKKLKKSCPKKELILKEGRTAQTHFSLDGLRSKINIKKFKKIIQECL
jgi:tRNA (guanine26-N2/guanine27-N2)-dimethyltransferase